MQSLNDLTCRENCRHSDTRADSMCSGALTGNFTTSLCAYIKERLRASINLGVLPPNLGRVKRHLRSVCY